MSNEKPIDCQCEEGDKRNEGNQHPIFVQELENPVIIEYIGRQPTKTFTGNLSGKVYKIGGRVQFQCVEKVDVPFFMDIRRGGNKEFRIWKPSSKRPQNPSVTDEHNPNMADRNPNVELDELIGLKGIGQSTAQKLLDGGQTVESLSEIEIENDGYITTLSDSIGVNKSLLIRAIQESVKWAETTP